MAFMIRRTRIAIGLAEVAPGLSELDDDPGTGPTLVFYRAAGEGLRQPGDVVTLLQNEGIKTGMLRARNPITHDQWWIPVALLAAAGRPYAKALASVVQTWLKERKGRRVELQYGILKVTCPPADTASVLRLIAKHAKELGLLQITGSKAVGKKSATRKSVRKKASGK